MKRMKSERKGSEKEIRRLEKRKGGQEREKGVANRRGKNRNTLECSGII